MKLALFLSRTCVQLVPASRTSVILPISCPEPAFRLVSKHADSNFFVLVQSARFWLTITMFLPRPQRFSLFYFSVILEKTSVIDLVVNNGTYVWPVFRTCTPNWSAVQLAQHSFFTTKRTAKFLHLTIIFVKTTAISALLKCRRYFSKS